MKTGELDIFVRSSQAIAILKKVMDITTSTMSDNLSPRKPFGLDGNIIKTSLFHNTVNGLQNPIKCYGKMENQEQLVMLKKK